MFIVMFVYRGSLDLFQGVTFCLFFTSFKHGGESFEVLNIGLSLCGK